MSEFLSDLRFGARMLRRRMGTSAIAVGTLALGVGAVTAIYSAVHPILVEAVPYPDAGRLTMLFEATKDGGRTNLGYTTFDDFRRMTSSFEASAAVGYFTATMTTDAEPRPFTGLRVSPEFFRVLGVAPAMGRDFRAEDDVRGTPRVIILSHATWRDAFGADPAIVGKSITLDGADYTVSGVMPQRFENVLAPEAQVWTPLRYETTLPWACRGCRHLRVVARRRADVAPEAAAAEVTAFAATMSREHPTEYAGAGMVATPLAEYLTSGVRPALVAVLVAVALVLLVAVLNVSNLLLARGASRGGEFAVRVALGADRLRLVRQLLTESVLLAVIGGVLGVALAAVGVRVLVALSPPELPRLAAIGLDLPVLGVSFAVTAIAGVLFGLMPAWRAARVNLQQGMRAGARHLVGGERLARSAIVVSEVALSLTLLVGAGLLLRSMEQTLRVDPGFEPAGVLTLQVQAGAGRLRNDTLVTRFFDDALETVRALPGVSSAAFTSQLPFSGDFDAYSLHAESRPRANPEEAPYGFRFAVSDDYFETMRIPLVRGRYFTAQDREGAPPVVILNAAFAAREFGDTDPIGQRVRTGPHDSGTWYEVIGLVGDLRHVSLEEGPVNAIYVPASQYRFVDYTRSLVIRSSADPTALIAPVRDAVWSVDKDQPLLRIASAEQLIAGSASERRFALVLFEAFAVVTLLLAAAGIYGVLLGSVSDRRRELGVRSAFGATTRDIVWLVLREGMTMSGIGVAAGLVIAFFGTRVIAGMLFGISAIDPLTYAAVVLLLLAVAIAACGMPAFRASRVEPMEVLRSD